MIGHRRVVPQPHQPPHRSPHRSPRRPSLRRIRAALVALLTVLTLFGWPAVAHAAPTVAFTIRDGRITESSGLARDPDHGVYWTINDSGAGGTVYALDGSGAVTGTVNFRARPTDVEAVQYHDRALYVADIGDNRARRDWVTVYVLYNTDPVGATVLYRAFDFAYPDGPHDAETLLIDRSGRIYLVTKGRDGAVYQAPAQPSRTAVNPLTRIAAAPDYVTDGQFLHDGRVALRTYTAVYILDPARGFREVARAPVPFQPQGESLTENLAGDGLLVGSEGRPSAVYAMPVPSGLPAVPSGGATPPTAPPTPAGPTAGTATASPGPSSGTVPSTDGGSGDGRSGTWIALVLAGLAALGAGLAAYALQGRRGAPGR